MVIVLTFFSGFLPFCHILIMMIVVKYDYCSKALINLMYVSAIDSVNGLNAVG